MASDNAQEIPQPPSPFNPVFGRIPRPNGFLALNEEPSPMATHGSGTLATLIKNRSTTSLQTMSRCRPSSIRGPDVEDPSPLDRAHRSSVEFEEDDFRRSLNEERRLSTILLGPQMRSQRLIGNSNPRYKWGKHSRNDYPISATLGSQRGAND
jgi:hypothetical protein